MQTEELKRLILEKAFEKIREYRKKELCKAISFFERGFLSKTEAVDAFKTALFIGGESEPISHAINALGLGRLPHTASVKFTEDLGRWKRNEAVKGEWLDRLTPDRDYFKAADFGSECGLSAQEILELTDSLLIPAVYYEQLPEEIPCPGIKEIHTYHNISVYAVPFDCIDDGGLLSDSAPAGKSFHIMRADGVKAHINVEEFRPKGTLYKRRGSEVAEYADHYLCIGTIDDYYFGNTTPPSVNISLYVSGEPRMDFAMTVYAYHEGEESIFSVDFPRWKEYNDYCRKRSERIDREVNELWNRLAESKA